MRILRDAVPCVPNASIRKRAQQLELCPSTVWKILRKDLGVQVTPQASVNSKNLNMADKPKRPILSAYMLWLSSAREQIKKDNPGIRVAKKGGQIWRAMEDKSEWEAKAAQAKEDYEEAIREYEANGGLPAGSGKKRTKPTKKVAKKSKKTGSDDDEDEESG